MDCRITIPCLTAKGNRNLLVPPAGEQSGAQVEQTAQAQQQSKAYRSDGGEAPEQRGSQDGQRQTARLPPQHTAGTGQPPSCIVGLRCRKYLHPKRRRMLTCTGRPDGSGARNDRLQPARCVRTEPLHARGMHGSGGCNGSRLPAVPDTSRHPQPWRSG